MSRRVQSADSIANLTRWNRACDRALPPQAFQLRDEGGAGQLGDGHHQDEGKIGISALMREVAGAVLTSRTCGDRSSAGGSSSRSEKRHKHLAQSALVPAPHRNRLFPLVWAKTRYAAFPPRLASRGAARPRGQIHAEERKVFQVTRH